MACAASLRPVSRTAVRICKRTCGGFHFAMLLYSFCFGNVAVTKCLTMSPSHPEPRWRRAPSHAETARVAFLGGVEINRRVFISYRSASSTRLLNGRPWKRRSSEYARLDCKERSTRFQTQIAHAKAPTAAPAQTTGLCLVESAPISANKAYVLAQVRLWSAS